MYKILESISSPEDINKLETSELHTLSKDIRKFLVKKVSNTGGHLASNLGVVELTLALHRVFNSPKDKIIWDVGHQSYVHKMITGRIQNFDTLRKYKGLSGFPKESESEHDMFDTGHSSTSISAALGMACARDIKNEDYEVISVIGDGAITGGMACEALNNLGYLGKNMIIVFNDNEMSIDKNTGAFSSYMSKIMTNKDAIKLRENIDKVMNITYVGEKLSKRVNRLTGAILSSVSPEKSGFMEELGIRYIGPIDGHNIEELIAVFESAKEIKGPKFIHVKTVKGKGYKYAEKYPELYHGVGSFDYREGVQKGNNKSISSVVGETLTEMADNNENIVAITAAMPTGTGLNIYQDKHPERYFDVGIAEQHAVTFAAGLAKQNMKPYFAVYSTFLQRGYDQLIHDVCITKKSVTFLIDRAGLVGNDGETHHGTFDLSYLNPIPNIVVMAPKDTKEMISMIKFSEQINLPVAIRYPRGNEYYLRKEMFSSIENIDFDGSPIERCEVGTPQIISNGFIEETKKIVVIAIGNMLEPAMKAINSILSERSDLSFSIINARYLKPIDSKVYVDIIKESNGVVTMEDGSAIGGFGSNIERIIESNDLSVPVDVIGVPDRFIGHGNTENLMDEIGMSPEKLKERIINFSKK
ncbi:1-deoxy-D-xylulose-5-phosphate synthase [Peptostreptococcus faecalis]|uniref:1-deoxy-D-xylulose-5-phosphate synthase n=1 Tax=Peptostreptococcus faecalis TaxID=2045015 RepID=UPI000C79DF3F|nr:1-deoxy-D-xylulose-5-phosphate synthase [Peptostreptococcus faecalis]